MKRVTNSSMPDGQDSDAVEFTLGGKGTNTKKQASSDRPVAAEPSSEKESDTHPRRTSKRAVGSRATLATARLQLPVASINHRVRTDIHTRIVDEVYRHTKAGQKRTKESIVDEAMDLGLQKLEGRVPSTELKLVAERLELPLQPLQYRVHADILERIVDEEYRYTKAGHKRTKASIVDEAMDIGLRSIEKRKLNS